MRKCDIKTFGDKALIVGLINEGVELRDKPTKQGKKILCWFLEETFARMGATVDVKELPHIANVATN